MTTTTRHPTAAASHLIDALNAAMTNTLDDPKTPEETHLAFCATWDAIAADEESETVSAAKKRILDALSDGEFLAGVFGGPAADEEADERQREAVDSIVIAIEAADDMTASTASRFDHLVRFDKLSDKQAAWAHKILAEAQAIIDAALEDCRQRMKPEKRCLLDGVSAEIDAKIARHFGDSYLRAPWDLFAEYKDGRSLAWRVGAVDYLDLCKNFVGPKLKRS